MGNLNVEKVSNLVVYDYLGKQVEVIEKYQAQGKQQIIWNAEGLPAGIYFCEIKINQGTQTTKLFKLSTLPIFRPSHVREGSGIGRKTRRKS